MQEEDFSLGGDHSRIPSREDWGDFAGDFDAADAFRNFFGKSNREMQPEFSKDALMRAQDLRFMPSRPFSYYIKGLADFVLFGSYSGDAPDIANSFISVVQDRADSAPWALASALNEVNDALDSIMSNSDRFCTHPEIYGDLTELAKQAKDKLPN
ncbi:hypothetical protein GM658_07070 [Pseudoduganella eburnea]|uniref:Uncharacterized protein n=1 Tax=Massilia eburnea TaxID=1776165 RepID=A0A6L6QE75_9BURK|nr:hypothetical protein [Massilia eburnea]MTW10364.1 hypothetical protein [Massilia eburnea]